MKRNKKIMTYMNEEEFKKIQEASRIKSLDNSSFLRMATLEKCGEILKEEGGISQ